MQATIVTISIFGTIEVNLCMKLLHKSLFFRKSCFHFNRIVNRFWRKKNYYKHNALSWLAFHTADLQSIFVLILKVTEKHLLPLMTQSNLWNEILHFFICAMMCNLNITMDCTLRIRMCKWFYFFIMLNWYNLKEIFTEKTTNSE